MTLINPINNNDNNMNNGIPPLKTKIGGFSNGINNNNNNNNEIGNLNNGNNISNNINNNGNTFGQSENNLNQIQNPKQSFGNQNQNLNQNLNQNINNDFQANSNTFQQSQMPQNTNINNLQQNNQLNNNIEELNNQNINNGLNNYPNNQNNKLNNSIPPINNNGSKIRTFNTPNTFSQNKESALGRKRGLAHNLNNNQNQNLNQNIGNKFGNNGGLNNQQINNPNIRNNGGNLNNNQNTFNNPNNLNNLNNPNGNQFNANQVNGNQVKNKKNVPKYESHIMFFIKVVFLFFSSVIFYDFWQIFLLHKPLLDSVFIQGVLHQKGFSSNDFLGIIDLFGSAILILLIFKPSLLNKKFKNTIYTYSERIVINIEQIVKNGLYNFNENRDELVKVIYFSIINLLIIGFYHYSLQNIYFETNKVDLLRTFIFGIIYLIGSIMYTNYLSLYILHTTKNNLVETRKDFSKIIYALLIYGIGLMALLTLGNIVSETIYNYIFSISWIHNIF